MGTELNYSETKEYLYHRIKEKDIDACIEIYEKLPDQDKANKELLTLSVMLKIVKMEQESKEMGLLEREEYNNIDAMVELYCQVKHAIRRLEFGIDEKLSSDILDLRLSKQMLLMMISLFSYDRRKTAALIEPYYKKAGNYEISNALRVFANEKISMSED